MQRYELVSLLGEVIWWNSSAKPNQTQQISSLNQTKPSRPPPLTCFFSLLKCHCSAKLRFIWQNCFTKLCFIWRNYSAKLRFIWGNCPAKYLFSSLLVLTVINFKLTFVPCRHRPRSHVCIDLNALATLTLMPWRH